jgi:hypothetical protein
VSEKPGETIYQIEYRLKGFRPGGWMRANALRPETRLQADRLVAACEHAMPAREYRVVEIAEVNEKDIPSNQRVPNFTLPAPIWNQLWNQSHIGVFI